MSGDVKGKGKPVFCGKDGRWKDELEKRLPTDDEIVALALGDAKYDVLRIRRATLFEQQKRP